VADIDNVRGDGSILSSTLVLSGGELLGQLAALTFMILLARNFGAETVGQYSLAMALGGSLAILISFGNRTLLIREISRDPVKGPDLIGLLLPVEIFIGLMVCSMVAAGLYLFVSDDSIVRRIILMIAAYQVLWHLTSLFVVQFRAVNRMSAAAFIGAGDRLIALILAAFAVLVGQAETVVIAAMPIGAMLMFMAGWRATYIVFGHPQIAFNIPAILSLAARSRHFLVMAILYVLYDRAGLFLLAAIEGTMSLGFYTPPDRIVASLGMLYLMLSAALLPVLSRCAISSKIEFSRIADQSLRISLLVAIPFAGLLIAFSADIIQLVFGSEFSGSAAALVILAPALVFRSMTSLWATQAIAIDAQRAVMLIGITCVALFLLLATLFIQYFSYIGLALAVLIAEMVQAASLAWLLARLRLPPNLLASVWRPLVATVVSIVVIAIIDPGSILVRIILTLVLLAGILWLSGAFRLDNYRLLAGSFAVRETEQLDV
jgi:O-antigen/teichoic acid export membrane protein